MNYIYTSELYHHGIIGQKWGRRRYQNSDGSLTEEGRIRYGKGAARFIKSSKERGIRKLDEKIHKTDSRIDRANKNLQSAKRQETNAGDEYLKAKTAYDKTARKLDKTQNGLAAKLVGVNSFAERQFQKKLEKDRNKLDFATTAYNRARDNTLQKEITAQKLSDLRDRYDAKLQRKSRKYIDKYGSMEFSKIDI